MHLIVKVEYSLGGNDKHHRCLAIYLHRRAEGNMIRSITYCSNKLMIISRMFASHSSIFLV
jgi:hypothetical protein